MLTSLILGPETDTTEKERPLDRHTGVRVAAGQGVVVVEHGALKLKVFLQEGHRLDLFHLLVQTRAVGWNARNLLNKPDVAGLSDSLVTVDLSLLVSPVGKRSRVSPHGHL